MKRIWLLTLVALFAGTLTATGTVRQESIAALQGCELALSIIDNEAGEAVESPEVLLFTKDSRNVLKGEAVAGKIVFKELKDGEYGFLAINEGFKNSFFRIVLDCESIGESGRKEVLLPLWKGEGNKTIVLEFAEGADHLQLKDLGLKKEDGSESPEAPTTISRGEVTSSAVKLFRPEYPDVARKMNVKGAVSVKVTIGFDGLIESAEAFDGPKLLRDAAVEAAKRSEFGPTYLMGVPIKIEGILIYRFGVH
ncbi:MAG TPA: energy transducer TonB [Aridibacter sp.]|nr:energy transducer TonB [Aridibacter sp.]